MPDLPSAGDDLTKLVPQGLLRMLRAHFSENINEAVRRYRFNDADEDSLTGALGQALSTPDHIVTTFNGVHYSFGIESYKILGKGPGAPEKRTGADGIFQVSVLRNGKPIFQKGLPFQAKKWSRYYEAEVLPQARVMLRTSESGMILRFGEDRYDAADARHLVGSNDQTVAPTPPGFALLGTVLGDWFLKCQIGRRGLAFSKDAPDVNEPRKCGFWVIDTRIKKTDANKAANLT